LIEPLFHLRVLWQTVAADLNEVRLQIPVARLDEGLGLKFFDDRLVLLQERGDGIERAADETRA